MIAFGQRVRALRKEAKLTQEDLAARSGLSKNYVGETERGERNPSLLVIHAFAGGLGVSPAELFAGR